MLIMSHRVVVKRRHNSMDFLIFAGMVFSSLSP